MAWPNGTPTKTYAPLGTFLPADANAIENRMLQVAGYRGYAEVLTDQALGAGLGPIDLATVGPSVTVTVPTNGLVELFATAELKNSSGGANKGYVGVAEDGVYIGDLFESQGTSFFPAYSSPGRVSPYGTAFRYSAGSIVLAAAAGAHTYKLVYSSLAAGTSNFKNRKLWVRTVGFE